MHEIFPSDSEYSAPSCFDYETLSVCRGRDRPFDRDHLFYRDCSIVGARRAVPVIESCFRDCAGLRVLKTGLFCYSVQVS